MSNATTLDQLIDGAKVLADRREHLTTIVAALTKAIEELKADRMPALRAAIDEASSAWSGLEDLIKANPGLFIKPRKVQAHGITFGLEKGKGSLDMPDPDKTVRLINKLFPDQADVLIDVKEVPAKGALQQLSAADLKRLGVEVKGAGDRAVIRASDGETDKLVKALIKSAVEDDDAE